MRAKTPAMQALARNSVFNSPDPCNPRGKNLIANPGIKRMNPLVSREENILASRIGHLSTIVEDFQWTSVYIMKDNSLGAFFVDRLWTEPATYPQVVHSSSALLSDCKCPAQKKKLDRLSTYPQSLLYLLFYKIYLKQDMNI